METTDRYIRFDWAVKRLLRQKANFGVLEGLLTVLLGEKVEIIELLESEGNQLTADDKFNRVDIKARNSKDEIIIVEVQNTRELYFLERILYGVAKAITEHISLGDRYHEVKKIYSISILYFDIGKGSDYLYHGQNTFTGVHTGDQLHISAKQKDALVEKLPSDVFPEYYLIRLNEFNQTAVTPLEEWIDYLKTGRIRPDTTAPGLAEAREKLIYYNMTAAERYAYDAHLNDVMIENGMMDSAKLEGLTEGRIEGRKEGRQEGLLEGRQEGLQEGRQEGLQEGRKEALYETGRNLKNMGLSTEMIIQGTGLSAEEIEKL